MITNACDINYTAEEKKAYRSMEAAYNAQIKNAEKAAALLLKARNMIFEARKIAIQNEADSGSDFCDAAYIANGKTPGGYMAMALPDFSNNAKDALSSIERVVKMLGVERHYFA